MKNLNNLLKFSDFDKNWKSEKANKTKRTDTGLDILKEDLYNEEDEEIINEPTEEIEEIEEIEESPYRKILPQKDFQVKDEIFEGEDDEAWAVVGYWMEDGIEKSDILSGEEPISEEEADEMLARFASKEWPEDFEHREEKIPWDEVPMAIADEDNEIVPDVNVDEDEE